MRNLTFVALALLVCSFTLDPWQEFVSYEGRFSVSVPAPMNEKITVAETPLGNLEYHTFFYQPDEKDADNLVYMVSYCDYPEGGMHSDSVDLMAEFFTATIESAAESVKGEILYQTDVFQQKYPGKLWRLTYRDGVGSIKSKAFLVKNRFYILQAVSMRDKGLNPAVDKFLDSFHFGELTTEPASEN